MILWVIMGVIIVLIVFTPYIISTFRHPKEKKEYEIYRERCGGMVDLFIPTTYPNIRVSLYENFFVVKRLKAKVIPYGKIKKLAIKKKYYRL